VALEIQAANIVSNWSSKNSSLRLKLLAMPALLTDPQVPLLVVGLRAKVLFQVVAALSAATSALRDDNSGEGALLTRAYKKSLLKLHPDKMPHADTWNKLLASQVFDALREAYAKEGF
jgi:hypothetical protein